MPLNADTLFHVDAYAEIFIDSLAHSSIDSQLHAYVSVVDFCYRIIHERAYLDHATHIPSSCEELRELMLHPHRFQILKLQPDEFFRFRLCLINHILKHLLDRLGKTNFLHNDCLPAMNESRAPTWQPSLIQPPHRRLPKLPAWLTNFSRDALVNAALTGALTGLLGFWIREVLFAAYNPRSMENNPLFVHNLCSALAFSALVLSVLLIGYYWTSPHSSKHNYATVTSPPLATQSGHRPRVAQKTRN